MAKIYKHKFGTEEFPVPIADKITGKITWLASEEEAATEKPYRVCKTTPAPSSDVPSDAPSAASSAML